tara:strand:- start:479 stop:1474 length:996 start_codon:yes stop_codon:yes gene_type:complete
MIKYIFNNKRNIFGLLFSLFLFIDSIICNDTKKTGKIMMIYLLIDIIDIIFLRPFFKLKYDIIIHHINFIFFSYFVLFLNDCYYDKYFVFQEFTTVIIFLRNMIEDSFINNLLNNILKISWIPLRIFLPLLPIYQKYEINDDNSFEFKCFMYCCIVSYLLNIKWTLDFSKFYNNTYHFSSIFLFNFIFFMKKNSFWFISGFLLTCISFVHHSLKNRLTKSLDASLITFINLKMINENITLIKNILCGLIGLIIKYIFPNSEIHSVIYTLTIIKCIMNSNYLFLFNVLTLMFGFYMFKTKNNSTIWHFTNSIAIINYMYINDLIENKFLNFS